jgi:hypothetical protein
VTALRAFLHFDSRYAPCGFLIVPEGGDPYDDKLTMFVQHDGDFPGVASRIGWAPCCGLTDGTIGCSEHGTMSSTMIDEAYSFLRKHEGEPFESLAEYLPETAP